MGRETRLILLSAALDLKRITTGYQSGSIKMSDRFAQEALRWIKDINVSQLDPYMRKIIKSLPQQLSVTDKKARAETALTYSLILQNYALAR
jgi:hypothetical protein